MIVYCKLHPDLKMKDSVRLENGSNSAIPYDSNNPIHGQSDEAFLYEELQVSEPADFVGMALHCIQQDQADNVCAYGYNLAAILMDQTSGVVDLNDILKTDHPKYPYLRLADILGGKFKY